MRRIDLSHLGVPMTTRKFSPEEETVSVSKSPVLFKPINVLTLPPREKEFVPQDYFVECPCMHIHPLLAEIVATSMPEQPHFSRAYTVQQLRCNVEDSVIHAQLPKKVVVTTHGVHVPTGLTSLGDVALMLGEHTHDEFEKSSLSMNEKHVTIFYVRGIGGAIYVVGGRWRPECRRWFLFAHPFNGRGRWTVGAHVIFPILTLQ